MIDEKVKKSIARDISLIIQCQRTYDKYGKEESLNNARYRYTLAVNKYTEKGYSIHFETEFAKAQIAKGIYFNTDFLQNTDW